MHSQGCWEPTCPAAIGSYLGTCYVGGLSFPSTAPAHVPASGSTLVWELDALWMEKRTGRRCFDEKNETLPSYLGLHDRNKTMNVAAPKVKKMLICDWESDGTNTTPGLQLL